LIDEVTYRHYLNEAWDSVIYYGRLARKNNISYYYLDLRMGIARFEKKQYLLAAKYFNKAASGSNMEDIPAEYLYLCYLYTGQYYRADLVTRKFSPTLSRRIPPAKSVFARWAGIETVYSFTNAENLRDELWGESLDGTRTLTRNMIFFQGSIIHQPSPGFTIQQTVSYLHKDNLYYIKSEASEVLFPDQNLNQLDYTLIPTISTRIGLSIIPSFHFTVLGSEVLEKVNFGYGMNSSTVVDINTDRFFIPGLELRQRVWLFNLSAGGSYLFSPDPGNYQQQLGMIFYPLGNMNLYLGLDYYLTEDEETGSYLKENILNLKLGGSISEKVWIEGRFTEGDMSYFRENNNAVFYNSPDYMIRKAQIHLSIPGKEHHRNFYLGARWADHIAPYFQTGDQIVDRNNTINYNSFTFYGGISWNML
jgi:hypothetical protein